MKKPANKRPPSIRQTIRRIKQAQARIARERDRLDDLVAEASSVLDDCQEADEALATARDALSRLL